MSTCEAKLDGNPCPKDATTCLSSCHDCYQLMTNGDLYIKNFGTKSENDYKKEVEELMSKVKVTGVLSLEADLKKVTEERDQLKKDKTALEAKIATIEGASAKIATKDPSKKKSVSGAGKSNSLNASTGAGNQTGPLTTSGITFSLDDL